jgi:hypothetical protein
MGAWDEETLRRPYATLADLGKSIPAAVVQRPRQSSTGAAAGCIKLRETHLAIKCNLMGCTVRLILFCALKDGHVAGLGTERAILFRQS